ncbi:protein NO VEIN domain-containing protein [Micromonospora chalcea]
MGNSEIERVAIEHVMELEPDGRVPEDFHLTGAPYDVSSPPRQIEVKAFGGRRATRTNRAS